MAAEGHRDLVLVTGASGFIATHVINTLIGQGYKVRGTVRSLKNKTKVKPVQDLGTPENPIELYEADLSDELSWLPAGEGCRYVLHIASRLPPKPPSHEDELIQLAVKGTLSLLQACREARGVKRVVITSSVAAVHNGYVIYDRAMTEEDWTHPEQHSGREFAYTKSKTLVERAAWDFMKELPEDHQFELAVVNPGYIIGPPICGSFATSMTMVSQLLQGPSPGVAKVGYAVVDVRDVVLAHMNAMTLSEAAGHRHILTTYTMWLKDKALLLKAQFEPQGYRVPTIEVPSLLVNIASWFHPPLKLLTAALDKFPQYDSSRMKNILGVNGRETKASLLDMAYKMIEDGHIRKTDRYTGPTYSE